MMIKSLFLPERLGTHRLLAQRIVGVSVHESVIRMTLVYAKGSKTIIEQLITEPIEVGAPETRVDRTAEALKNALADIKSYDQIRVAFPSSLVIFKELSLQFTDLEKIRMVLDYEIESMLPFSINDAVVDFVITRSNKAEQVSQILVAAVRNQDMQDFLALLGKANIDPSGITVDLFAQYSLYEEIASYRGAVKPTALVEIGEYTTRISLLHNDELRLTRHLPRGLNNVISSISQESGVGASDLEARLAKYSLAELGEEPLVRATQKHFTLLLNDIQFTLNSFSMKLALPDEIGQILLAGPLERVFQFTEFCSTTMQIPCELFDCKKLLTSKAFKNKVKNDPDDWSPFVDALGSALTSTRLRDFDLRRKQFTYHAQGLSTKQLIVASMLVILTLGTIATKGFLELSALEQQINKHEEREIGKIKSENIFPKDKFPKKAMLTKVVREAERIVKEKRDIWAAFKQGRMNELGIWLELTNIINRKMFDVSIDEISISKNKDDGKPRIEVEGIFRSKTSEHFQDWAGLEGRFKGSSMLKLTEPADPQPSPDGNGVKFTVKMKLKEE